VSGSDRKAKAENALNETPRHPSYDPSGDEPAGSSTGVPGRSFADAELADTESEQARGRRESAATGDPALRPPDQDDDA
jgi:hypothetical protein